MSGKKQNILVLVQDERCISVAIHHSFSLAKFFNAEVAIIKFPDKNSTTVTTLNRDKIDKFVPFPIPYRIIESGKHKLEPNYSIQQLDAIFIVTQFNRASLRSFPKQIPIFKWILRARIPSVLVTEQTSIKCNFRNIVVPVDYRKESKEKMIWASYFGRFNKANIHLLAAKEHSESRMQTVRATLVFTKRMFKQFAFNYKIIPTKNRSSEINREAIEYSKQFNSDLLVLMSGRNIGWIDTYSGPKQVKKILRKELNPILFINPLKDYYLPCN